MPDSVKTKYDLASETSLKTQATNNAETSKKRHRELLFDVKPNKSYTSFLKFIDYMDTWYIVPLGDTDSNSKTSENKNDNMLVPIILLIYTGPECETKYTTNLREGYLYIYKDNYLWRELKVVQGGFFQDINLKTFQGKDYRTVTVERDNRILLPHKINGKETKIEMCYSEIQWSWARINTMGGMDKNDIRIDKDKPPKFAPEHDIFKVQAQKNRTARMQEMDFSGYTDGFPVTEACANKSKIEMSTSSDSKTYTQRLHKKSKLPVVYLYDPIGVARNNLGVIYKLKKEFEDKVVAITKHKYYKSAILAYQTFFNEDLLKSNKVNSSLVKNIGLAKENIDKDFLTRVLEVKSRKIDRKKIRETKTLYVEFMEGKFKKKDIIDKHPDFISFDEALKDYAELEVENYSLLWQTFLNMITILPFDPSLVDKALDIKADHDQVKRHEDIGHTYLKNILDPIHFLHKVIFPTKVQVDEYSPNYKIDNNTVEILDGTGNFRPSAFAQCFINTNTFRPTSNKISEPLNSLQKIVGEISMLMSNQVFGLNSFSITKPVAIKINPVIRLLIALNDPEFEGVHLVKKDTTLKDLFVLDGRFTVIEKIIQAENKEAKYGKPSKNPGWFSGLVNIIDPNTKKAIGSVKLSQMKNMKGKLFAFNEKDWKSLFVKGAGKDGNNSKDESSVSNEELVTVSKATKLAANLTSLVKEISVFGSKLNTTTVSGALSGNKSIPEIPSGDDEFKSKKLPTFLVIFEVINIMTLCEKLDFSKPVEATSKDITKLALAAIALPYSILEAGKELIGVERITNIVSDITSKKKFAKKLFAASSKDLKVVRFKYFSTLTKVSILSANAGAMMSIWDSFDAFIAGDEDAGFAYAVQAVSGIGLALTSFGPAGAGFSMLFGPLGFAFLFIVLISGLVASWLTDSDIEKWALHGPFGARGNKLTNQYKDRDSKFIFEALLALLMVPRVQITDNKKEQLLYVDVHVPGFEPGKSTLTVHTFYEKGLCIPTGIVILIPDCSRPVFKGDKQYKINLLACMPLLNKKMPNITLGLRYIYQRPNFQENVEVGRIYSRVQHFTKDGYKIPMNAYYGNPKKADLNFIDKDIKGWAYAEPLVIRWK